MHILVTNDDGPPSTSSSPYIQAFVNALHEAGHTTTIVIPNQQRSWIGKAHIAHTTVTARKAFYPDDIYNSASPQGNTEWILVDGTPATCTQIGLGFYQPGKKWGEGFDLVVSGPNYGRNSTAVFALSSGTLGGALEAAVCGIKGIALSFAFDTREHNPKAIADASRASVKVVEQLAANWDPDVEVYSVNVPLGIESLSTPGATKVKFSTLLGNKWTSGACFEELPRAAARFEESPDEREREIREEEEAVDSGLPSPRRKTSHDDSIRKFRWAPIFKDVYESVEKAGEGTDGWVVKEGQISITAMKANFAEARRGADFAV